MRIFSGIQPTNLLHIGNYLGALRQWLALQEDNEAIYCIVDLHAITIYQEPAALRENTLNTAMLYMALGLDPEQSIIFVQSHIPAHSELAWILNTIAKMGELERMTQYKDKSKRFPEKINMGLFDYPILMAADILLYDTEGVPVGDDQKQHVELARDLAQRFNKTFGEAFVVPKPMIPKEGARIMSLDDPKQKMSKSATSTKNYVSLTDDAGTIQDKIKRAVTDSGAEITSGAKKPALTNLLSIYSLLTETPINTLEAQYAGKGYGDFKTDLAEVIIEFLAPIQERLAKLQKNPKKVEKVLAAGAERAEAIAHETMKRVRERVGLL